MMSVGWRVATGSGIFGNYKAKFELVVIRDIELY